MVFYHKADDDDDDDSKNNKVEEPTEEDNKSPCPTYGIYLYLYLPRCLSLSNYLLFSCSLFRDALSSKDYSQRIKTSLFHSTLSYM